MSLLGSLSTSGKALDAFQRSLAVIQSNIDNVSTPGYAKQRAALSALPLDLAGGLLGGVAMNGLENSRSKLADAEVRRQLQLLGQYTAQSQSLDRTQNLFDVTGNSGVPAGLSKLFQSFSAWSANPSDLNARQAVIDSALALADTVRGMSQSLADTAKQLDSQVDSTVRRINTLAGAIRSYNTQRLQRPEADPAADATLQANLEELSQLANVTMLSQSDGTITVLAGGSTPLVIGDKVYELSSSVAVSTSPIPTYPLGPPSAHVLDSEGKEITGTITSGELGGLLDVRNRVLASISGDAQREGSLNRFAKSLADSVNQILTSGTVSSVSGAAAGVPLFSYNTSDATQSARSLTITSITPDQLAPVDSTGISNGNALKLAALANTNQAGLSGMSLTGFFGQIAANVGQETQSAKTSETTQQQAAAGARSMRDQISGVSLDEEGVRMIEFQRGYEAAARVLSVLSDLVQTTIQMIQ